MISSVPSDQVTQGQFGLSRPSKRSAQAAPAVDVRMEARQGRDAEWLGSRQPSAKAARHPC